LDARVTSTERVSAITRPPTGDLVLLAVAVLAIATSAPLIAATTVGPLALSFWRSLLGSAATLPWAWLRHRDEMRSLSRYELRWTLVAGLLLALHFSAWLPSLRFTSVASSTALVSLQPVWAALLARLQGAHVPRSAWVGIVVALVGVLVLTGIDVSLDPRHLVGDLLALVGGMLSAAYVTAGERVRRTVSTPTYTTVAYAVAAAVLLPLCVLLGQPLVGYSRSGWATVIALTVGAQLMGHTLINRVLRTTSATVTSLAILFEMPGATLIAAVWLGQVPPLSIVPAVALILVGLVLVIRAGDPRTPSETPPV
jgi:drug/metabolite transporter (DMT)-like permease